jgi:hypothetical protein
VDEVDDKTLRAKGAALRLEEDEAQVRQYMGAHWRQLIEEIEMDARAAVEKLRNGAESIPRGTPCGPHRHRWSTSSWPPVV